MTPEADLSYWARERERGSSFLLRIMVWISLRLGQALGETLLIPITAWFFTTSPASRAASRDYLRRALGRKVRAIDVAHHILEFARVILDRVFFLAGHSDRYHTDIEGLAHLNAHIAAGRGCVLLGAHLGSFDAMRAMARGSPARVRPAMYRGNAGALTAIMERLDPELAAGIIDIGKPEAMLQVRESLERGDLVAFLADRATDPRRSIAMPFFGEPAMFPTGPFQIAAMLRAPAIMVLGVRTGHRRYSLRFEPLTGPSASATAPHKIMSAYVSRLEAACRAYPFQWFNFYSFWRPNMPDRPLDGDKTAQKPTRRDGVSPAPSRPPCPTPSWPGASGPPARKHPLTGGPDEPGQDVERGGRTARFNSSEVKATHRPISCARPTPSLGVSLAVSFLLSSAPSWAADDPARLLTTLMHRLAEKTERQSTFREEKTVPFVTGPLVSSGVLIFRGPVHLEKRTLAPFREDLIVEGRQASLTSGGEETHVVDIDAHAELRVVIDTLIGVLSGDLNRLRADFDVAAEGDAANWRITLRPRGPDAPRFLREASVTGRAAAIREIRLLLPRDNWDVMTVDGG